MMATKRLQAWASRRHHAVVAVFITSYVVAWAYVVGLTDPAQWDALLALGFGVLFALVLIHEIVATADSLRAKGPQAPLPASVGAGRHAVVAARADGVKAPEPTRIGTETLAAGPKASVRHD
jgi:hypothetical protein